MVGNKVRAIRKSNNITQKQLAEGTNYSKSYIGDIETGRTQPSLKALITIMNFLKADPSDFFEMKCCFERMKEGIKDYCNHACENQMECPISNLNKDKENKE